MIGVLKMDTECFKNPFSFDVLDKNKNCLFYSVFLYSACEGEAQTKIEEVKLLYCFLRDVGRMSNMSNINQFVAGQLSLPSKAK